MDEIKLREAFDKIKLELNVMKTEFLLIKKDIESIKTDFVVNNMQLHSLLTDLNQKLDDIQTSLKSISSLNQSNTYSNNPTTHLPQSNTYSSKFEGIKPYIPISNGNNGVPTIPQQTNTQSNTSPTHDFIYKTPTDQQTESLEPKQDLRRISIKELVSSMKSELKAKFKALTKQEMHVFSTLFTMEQELRRPLNYKEIASKTSLTESTIRDYISRLIDKGIPIIKERVNNKDILLKIDEELRNFASLERLSSLNKQNDFRYTE